MQPSQDPQPSNYQPANGWEDYQAGHLAAQTRLLGQIARAAETIRTILVVFVILTVLGVVVTLLSAT